MRYGVGSVHHRSQANPSAKLRCVKARRYRFSTASNDGIGPLGDIINCVMSQTSPPRQWIVGRQSIRLHVVEVVIIVGAVACVSRMGVLTDGISQRIVVENRPRAGRRVQITGGEPEEVMVREATLPEADPVIGEFNNFAHVLTRYAPWAVRSAATSW